MPEDNRPICAPVLTPSFPGRACTVTTSKWGATLRRWKDRGGVPEFLDFTIKDPDSRAEAKERMQPTEVKAGMEPTALNAHYGDDPAFHGGLNAVLFEDMETMAEEMRRVMPAMKEKGGYVISSDHSVPETVSLQDFQRFVDLARDLGAYG